MRLTTFIVRSAAGTRILGCPAEAVSGLLGPGETAAPATEADLNEHRANMAKVIQDAVAVRQEALDPVEVMVEALKRKGISITNADLTAAAVDVRKRRDALAKGAN